MATLQPTPFSPDGLPLVPLAQLEDSPANPRRAFDDVTLRELAASIAQHGLLMPLLVRRVVGEDHHYSIIAGHRRARAAALAGLTEVPVLIREVANGAASEEALVENLQREQLPALDEARAFRALGQPAAAVAAAMGKSERYVWDRMKLLDLIPNAQTLLESQHITVAHAIRLARLTPAQQAKAIDPDGGALFTRERTLDFEEDGAEPADPFADLKAVSVREFDAWIAEHVRFDVTQAAAAAPLDFGEVGIQVAEAEAQPGRGRKVVAITHDHFVKPEARGEERTFCRASWKRADGQDGSQMCDRAVLGVVVVGPGYGEAFKVCIRKECDVHWSKERESGARSRQRKTSPSAARLEATRLADQTRRAEAQAKEDAARTAWKAARPAILDALIQRLPRIPLRFMADQLLADLEPFGGQVRREVAQRLGLAKTADAILRHAMLIGFLMKLDDWDGPKRFPPLVKRVGIDIAGILKAQAQTAPAPAAAKTTRPRRRAQKKR